MEVIKFNDTLVANEKKKLKAIDIMAKNPKKKIRVVSALNSVTNSLINECIFEEDNKQLNLFVMGVGNVGRKFIEQIHQQNKFLQDNLKINIRVIGMSNSRKMCFDESGIALNDWKSILDTGETANKEAFISTVKKLKLRNSVFVDITANEAISQTYDQYLSESVAVVSSNKIACSSAYENYGIE